MEKRYKILLAEDERMLAEILSDTLNDKQFDVDLAYDGRQALKMASEKGYDVIVTDIMMPQLDGFSFIKQIRQNGCSTPVLFLTARTATEDVVKGFDIGGNDYLRKPFAIDELIARIKALAKHRDTNASSNPDWPARYDYGSNSVIYQLGKYLFSPKDCSLSEELRQQTIKLAARECAVLHTLCRQMNVTVESSELLKEHWGDDNFFNLRSLTVYITRLRNHLKDEPAVKIISVRGVGYRLEVS